MAEYPYEQARSDARGALQHDFARAQEDIDGLPAAYAASIEEISQIV
jgi:hypothetical protein